jgi:Domain of unknown function (DUF4405)
MMDKPKLNFIIDALMFLTLMALAGLGFLMKYILVSGRDAWTKYGRNLALSWLGWDRHDWGDLHFYLAFALLILLVFHLFLHWRQILAYFHHLFPHPGLRFKIALIFLLLSLLLIYFPFMITPDVQERGGGGGRGGRSRSQMHGSESWLVATLYPGQPPAKNLQRDHTNVTFPLPPWSYRESPVQG